MALSRRTFDTDMLTIRQVWAYNSNNSIIPALQCLTTDGQGGTFWAVPSSLGGLPAWNTIVANGLPIVATAPSNSLILSTFGGLAMIANSTTKRIDLAATCFQRFEVSSGNTLVAYSNQTITPTVRFVASGSLNISADPLTNTLYFQTTPTSISTGIFGYSQVAVTSNTASPGDIGVLTATSPSTMLRMFGTGDLLLSTNITSNAVYFSISSFDAATFLSISSVTGNMLSSVSSLFVDKIQFSTGLSNLSTSIGSNFAQTIQYITNNYVDTGTFGYFSNTTTSNVSSLFTKTFGLNTGLLSSVNIFSSLGGTPSGVTAGSNTGAISTFLFSSASFSLFSLNSNIQKAQHTVVEYRPSFVLEGNVLSTSLTWVSTLIYAEGTGGGSYLPSSLFTRTFWSPSNADQLAYTDSLQIELDPIQLSTSITSTYQFHHFVTNFSSATASLTDYTSPTNALSVRITGTNFAGVY